MPALAQATDSIPAVATQTERDISFPTPRLNQRVHRLDTKAIERWSGSEWVVILKEDPVGNKLPEAASTAARDALFPTPASGDQVLRTDLSTIERYNGTAWETVIEEGSGVTEVADPAARDALSAIEGDLARVDFTGNIDRKTGAEWKTVVERPLEWMNPKMFGARGNGFLEYPTQAWIDSHPEFWDGYDTTDSYDTIGCREAMFRSLASGKTTATVTAVAGTTLTFGGANFGANDAHVGRTLHMRTGGARTEYRRITASTATTITVASAFTGTVAVNDSAMIVHWNASGAPHLNLPTFVPAGRYLINRRLIIYRAAGYHFFGANRFATVIAQNKRFEETVAVDGMSWSVVEGIAFHYVGQNQYDIDTWTPGLSVSQDAYYVPPTDGYIWKAQVGGTTQSISISAATNTYPIEITTATPHGFGHQDVVRIQGATGNTAINGKWTISVVDATRFKIPAIGNGVLAGTPIVGKIPTFTLAGGAPDVTDGSVTWRQFKRTVVFDLNWDGNASGWAGACQSNTIANCHFSVEGRKGSIGLALANSGDGSMGSESTILNTFYQWFSLCGIFSNGLNALQNTVIGGNIGSCSKFGIYVERGGIHVYSMGFQNGLLSLLETAGYDIWISNSANDISGFHALRTESLSFCRWGNYHKVQIAGCHMNIPDYPWSAGMTVVKDQLMSGTAGPTGKSLGTLFKCTHGGTTGGTEPDWGSVSAGSDPSNRWIQDGTAVWEELRFDAVTGNSGTIEHSIFLFGGVFFSDDKAFSKVSNCSFSMKRWWNRAGGGYMSANSRVHIEAVSVIVGAGPNGVSWVSPWRFGLSARDLEVMGGFYTADGIFFPAPLVTGSNGMLNTPGIVRGAYPKTAESGGFIGMLLNFVSAYEALRPRLAVTDWATNARASDARGLDFLTGGGLPTGTAEGGRHRIQVAEGGLATGEEVGLPVDRLVTWPDGRTVAYGPLYAEKWDMGPGNGATPTVNWKRSSYQRIVLDANVTSSTFANPPSPGVRLVLDVTQDATGGRTFVWPTSVKWAGGAAPTLTVTAHRTDKLGFDWDGQFYHGYVIAANVDAPSDAMKLIADLGGGTGIKFFADLRYKRTVINGYFVDQWGDLRQAGPNAAPPAAANRPILRGGGVHDFSLTADEEGAESDYYLQTPAETAFDLNGDFFLAFGHSFPGLDARYNLPDTFADGTIIQIGDGSNGLRVERSGTSYIGRLYPGPISVTASAVLGASKRTVILSKGGTTLKLAVPNQAQQTQAYTTQPAAGARVLRIFGLNSRGTATLGHRIHWVMLGNFDPSAAQRDMIRDWSNLYAKTVNA